MVIAYPILYSKYEIHSRKGLPLLYFKMNKTLYGLPKIAIMVCKNLRGELESIGFEINPYAHCVACKNINLTHMTITCHVDDLKVVDTVESRDIKAKNLKQEERKRKQKE